MTIHQFPSNPPTPERSASAPTRSGEPWTDDDYELLLRLCGEGADLARVAAELRRTTAAVMSRAKRLLPLDQRGAPGDRVLTHLGELVTAEEDYDWRAHLAATPPPRPVINHVIPPEIKEGIPGLERHELLAMGAALAQLREREGSAHHLSEACAHEIISRNLVSDLQEVATRAAAHRVEHFLLSAHYPYSGTDCWALSKRYDREDVYERPHSAFVDEEPPEDWDDWDAWGGGAEPSTT
ncbi:hypothetical protein ACQBAT_11595 [Ornithinimicrobium sp. Y1847]|uniref:hypothetical protein n=1 Tax=Ornithinimicrobium sp. Y1847 TaxID=3405419 RepID=UPI003B66B117